MAIWTNESQPFGANHTPLLAGLSSIDGITPVPVAVDPATGAILTEAGSSGGSNVNIVEVGGANITLGQTTMSASLPVVIASDNNIAKESGGNLATIATNTGNSATAANQTNGNQQTKLTNGTNIADVVAGDTGFNGVATASATKTYTFTTSASGAQTILANTNVQGYSWIEIVYTSVGSGLALNGQWSTTSGGTYVNGSSFYSQAAGQAVLGVASGTIYYGPIHGNYFQIAVSALTSGTFAGTVTLRSYPQQTDSIKALQSGTWTVGSNSATGSAVPANAFYIAGTSSGGNLTGAGIIGTGNDAVTPPNGLATGSVGYVYNGTTIDRQRSATAANNTTGTGLLGVGLLEFDGTNYQRVPSARFSPSGTKLNTYSTRISTATTTTPTASTAYVSSIVICVETAAATATVDIRDKSGTPIYLIRSLSLASVLANGNDEYTFPTPILMTGGIDIITSTSGSAATLGVFVNYYA